MTLYEYKCRGCGIHWEDFGSMLERKQSTCPQCAGPGVRMWHAPAYVESLGHHMYPNRSPEYARRPKSEDDERRYHAMKREAEGGVVVTKGT